MDSSALERDAADGTVGSVDIGKQGLATVAGLLGAVAASSCCVLPIALLSLGAGGVWIGRLSALSPYQPVFVAVALGFLGYGFWLVYGRRSAACAVGGARAPQRLVKTGLWTATALAATAVVFPFATPLILG